MQVIWYSYYRRVDGSKLAPADLTIRCGDYDLRSADTERYGIQENDVDTFTIHYKFTGSNESDAFALRHNVAVIHTKKYVIQKILKALFCCCSYHSTLHSVSTDRAILIWWKSHDIYHEAPTTKFRSFWDVHRELEFFKYDIWSF